MTTLQYSALDADNSEIRLLDIAPGDGDDEICCSLSVVSLNSHPQYEALSYVWGDLSIKKGVMVDKVSHLVTMNLESALRDLRYPSKIRTIWVDAICINQVDLIEKNHQIPLMGDIYRKASGVVAYLGHSSPFMEHFLERLYEDSHEQSLLSSPIPPTDMRAKDILSLRSLLGLLEFVSHPYFSRMWTFQEYLLPSRRPTFVIGKKSFQVGHFPRETLENLFRRYCSTLLKAGERLSRASEREVQKLDLLCYSRLKQYVTDGMDGQLVVVGETLAGQNGLNTPMTLFLATSHRSCSDPRDKIFAIHPFLQEMVSGICAPDYTKSPGDVILETLSKIHERFPQFIRGCMEKWPLRASSVEDALGPSWLPDITAACYQPKVAGSRPTTLRISQDFLLLTLGIRFIGKCHPSPIKLGSEPEETLRRIAGLMYSRGEDLHSFAGSEIRVRRKENLSERILFALHEWTGGWKILWDCSVLSIFSTIAQYKGIKKLDDIPFTADQRLVLYKVKYAAKSFANKAFFWTDAGLFGTCSERLREGDTIVITSELARPLAIRTRLDPSGEPNHYSMVDRVFVDGLEGATMDAELVNEIRETPLSDVYIH